MQAFWGSPPLKRQTERTADNERVSAGTETLFRLLVRLGPRINTRGSSVRIRAADDVDRFPAPLGKHLTREYKHFRRQHFRFGREDGWQKRQKRVSCSVLSPYGYYALCIWRFLIVYIAAIAAKNGFFCVMRTIADTHFSIYMICGYPSNANAFLFPLAITQKKIIIE